MTSFWFKNFSRESSLIPWMLIFLLPFWSSHYAPLTQWMSEATVIWLILACWLFLLACKKLALAVPAVSVWMLCLAGIWWGQAFILPMTFPGMNQATAICFVGMALLGYVTQSLKQNFGVEKLVVWLAWTLFGGALLQSLIGLCQVTGWVQHMNGLLPYDPVHVSKNIVGSIGQRNLYAHYLSWGLLGAGYLCATGKLPVKLAVPSLLWLAVSISLSGSRTALLFAAVLIIFPGVWHFRLRQCASKRLWLVLGLTGLTVIAAQFITPLVDHLLSWHTSASGVERLAAAVGSSEGMSGRRWVEWHKAWLVFQNHPLFGVGWSQFGAQSVQLHLRPEFADAPFNSALFSNAHNVLLQLMAEMGVIGSLAGVGGFLWVSSAWLRRPASCVGVLPVCMIGIILAHSMLEYPLWYLYFLAALVVTLTLAPDRDKADQCQFGSVIRRFIPLFSILPGGFLLLVSLQGLMLYRQIVSMYAPPADTIQAQGNVFLLRDIIDKHPMYAFPATESLANYFTMDGKDIAFELPYIKNLASIRPMVYVLFDKARMEALSGQTIQAQQTFRMALASYPTYAKPFLGRLPVNEPAYAPLRAMAQRTYEQLPAKYKNVEQKPQ